MFIFVTDEKRVAMLVFFDTHAIESGEENKIVKDKIKVLTEKKVSLIQNLIQLTNRDDRILSCLHLELIDPRH